MSSSALEYKDAGNVAFKSGDYPTAIEQYTHALDVVDKTDNDTIAQLYFNRAMCLYNTKQYIECYQDCTHGIKETDPSKPLFFKLKYRQALAVKTYGDDDNTTSISSIQQTTDLPYDFKDPSTRSTALFKSIVQHPSVDKATKSAVAKQMGIPLSALTASKPTSSSKPGAAKVPQQNPAGIGAANRKQQDDLISRFMAQEEQRKNTSNSNNNNTDQISPQQIISEPQFTSSLFKQVCTIAPSPSSTDTDASDTCPTGTTTTDSSTIPQDESKNDQEITPVEDKVSSNGSTTITTETTATTTEASESTTEESLDKDNSDTTKDNKTARTKDSTTKPPEAKGDWANEGGKALSDSLTKGKGSKGSSQPITIKTTKSTLPQPILRRRRHDAPSSLSPSPTTIIISDDIIDDSEMTVQQLMIDYYNATHTQPGECYTGYYDKQSGRWLNSSMVPAEGYFHNQGPHDGLSDLSSDDDLATCDPALLAQQLQPLKPPTKAEMDAMETPVVPPAPPAPQTSTHYSVASTATAPSQTSTIIGGVEDGHIFPPTHTIMNESVLVFCISQGTVLMTKSHLDEDKLIQQQQQQQLSAQALYHLSLEATLSGSSSDGTMTSSPSTSTSQSLPYSPSGPATTQEMFYHDLYNTMAPYKWDIPSYSIEKYHAHLAEQITQAQENNDTHQLDLLYKRQKHHPTPSDLAIYAINDIFPSNNTLPLDITLCSLAGIEEYSATDYPRRVRYIMLVSINIDTSVQQGIFSRAQSMASLDTEPCGFVPLRMLTLGSRINLVHPDILSITDVIQRHMMRFTLDNPVNASRHLIDNCHGNNNSNDSNNNNSTKIATLSEILQDVSSALPFYGSYPTVLTSCSDHLRTLLKSHHITITIPQTHSHIHDTNIESSSSSPQGIVSPFSTVEPIIVSTPPHFKDSKQQQPPAVLLVQRYSTPVITKVQSDTPTDTSSHCVAPLTPPALYGLPITHLSSLDSYTFAATRLAHSLFGVMIDTWSLCEMIPSTLSDLSSSSYALVYPNDHTRVYPSSGSILRCITRVSGHIHNRKWAKKDIRSGKVKKQLSAYWPTRSKPAKVKYIWATQNILDVLYQNNKVTISLYTLLSDILKRTTHYDQAADIMEKAAKNLESNNITTATTNDSTSPSSTTTTPPIIDTTSNNNQQQQQQIVIDGDGEVDTITTTTGSTSEVLADERILGADVYSPMVNDYDVDFPDLDQGMGEDDDNNNTNDESKTTQDGDNNSNNSLFDAIPVSNDDGNTTDIATYPPLPSIPPALQIHLGCALLINSDSIKKHAERGDTKDQ